MNRSRSRPKSSRKPASRGLWIVLSLVGGLVGFLVLILCTLQFGAISGEEFSPDTFDRRAFSYLEIPLIRIQITPVNRKSSTREVEQQLVKDKLITASSSATPRWDLVRMSSVDPKSDKCDARILCMYFDSKDADGKASWLAWNEKHPELAKLLWPAVEEVARAQLYIFVPDLVACARSATDAKKFDSELKLVLARRYREFGEIQEELGRHDDALKLFEASLGHHSDSAATLRARAKSYEALGETDKAAKDRLAATKLPDDS